MSLPIAPEAADDLAYYKSAQSMGVLAPRGWQCFGTYGSNGASLFVTPTPIKSADLFSPKWMGFPGPAVEIGTSLGDTSGRLDVAEIIARAFPAHRDFVRDLMRDEERNDDAIDQFTFGRYPGDKMNYVSDEVTEFQTPGNKDGLGTQSRLKKNGNPISGVAILVGQAPDLVQLCARLPLNYADLTRTIVQQVERDAESKAAKP